MSAFKWFASFVLAATIVSSTSRRTALPWKCRKCTLPSCKPLPDDRGGIRQPFRPLQLSVGHRHPDHDGRSLLGR